MPLESKITSVINNGIKPTYLTSLGSIMLVELATAILLVWFPMDGIGKPLVYAGIALVAVVWLSTAFIQVPCHEKLVRGFDPAADKWRVNSNWIRTTAWTARGVVVS